MQNWSLEHFDVDFEPDACDATNKAHPGSLPAGRSGAEASKHVRRHLEEPDLNYKGRRRDPLQPTHCLFSQEKQ